MADGSKSASITVAGIRTAPEVGKTGDPDQGPGNAHDLVATWNFPFPPLVAVSLDGTAIAHADYVEASASMRWAIWWDSAPRTPLPLHPLATFVPEEIDDDPGLQRFALRVVLEAVRQQLLRTPSTGAGRQPAPPVDR